MLNNSNSENNKNDIRNEDDLVKNGTKINQ